MQNISKIVLFVFLVFILIWVGSKFFPTHSREGIGVEKSAHYDKEFNFQIGKMASYELDFNQSSILKISKKVPLSQEFQLKSILNMKILQKDGNDSVWALVQLSNIELDANKPNAKIMIKKLKKVYSKVFLIHFSKEGKIIDLKFDGLEENYMSLKQAFFLMETIDKPYKYYEVNEFDINGKYKASYNKDNNVISKEKLQYYKDQNNQNFIVLDYNSTAMIDKNGIWLHSLAIEEKIKDKKDDFENYNEISLNKIGNSIDSSLKTFYTKKNLSKYMQDFTIAAKSDKNMWKEIKNDEDKEMIDKLKISLDFVMNKISKNPKDANNFLLLSKYLKAHPEGIKKLVAGLNNFNDYVQMHIISTLQYIDTDEAQKALIQIAKSSTIKDDNSVRAIAAIGMLEKPKHTLVKALDEVIEVNSGVNEEKVNTSILALGTLSNKIDKDVVDDKIKTLYNNTDSFSKKRILLYSIENAGADEFLDELKQELKSKSTKNRLLSLDILAKMKDKNSLKEILNEQKKLQSNKKVLSKIENLLNLLKKIYKK